MRKLKKLILKSLQESGVTDDETQLSNILEQKVSPPKGTTFLFSGSVFTVYVKDQILTLSKLNISFSLFCYECYKYNYFLFGAGDRSIRAPDSELMKNMSDW